MAVTMMATLPLLIVVFLGARQFISQMYGGDERGFPLCQIASTRHWGQVPTFARCAQMP